MVAMAFSAWWIDPLLATIGFAVPICIYTKLEVETKSSKYKNYSEFFLNWNESPDLIKALISYWAGVMILENLRHTYTCL